MDRKKQIEEASNADNIVYFDNKPEFNFSLMEAFRWGANWADKNPVVHPVEIRYGEKRMNELRDIWEKAFGKLVLEISDMETAADIAKMFFELGFHAADENPIKP